MNSLTENIRRIFAHDHYATDQTGIAIEHADTDSTVCTLTLDKRHRNARGAVMGGVMFTLADYTFAIASNTADIAELEQWEHVELRWVSESSYINFLSSPKGNALTATARCIKRGRNRCLFQIDIHDDTGRHVATVTTNGTRIQN